jgi:hypothetical protein
MVRDVRGEWSDPERVPEYLAREIPHRDVAEGMLRESSAEQVERFLDLGTGAAARSRRFYASRHRSTRLSRRSPPITLQISASAHCSARSTRCSNPAGCS